MKSFAACAALFLAMLWVNAARAAEAIVLRLREVHSRGTLVQNESEQRGVAEAPKAQPVAAGDEIWSAETRITPDQPFYVKYSMNGHTFELRGTLRPAANGMYIGDVAFSKTAPIEIQGGDKKITPVSVSQGQSTVTLRKNQETPLMTTNVGEKSTSFQLTLSALAAEKDMPSGTKE